MLEEKRLSPTMYKTKVTVEGRECTKCGEFKVWDLFTTSNKEYTGRTANCKACKKLNRGRRDIQSDKYCAKKRRAELIKSDPLLVKARDYRGRLLARARNENLDIKDTTPTTQELEAWFKGQPIECYYSGVPLTLKEITVDHKLPVSRGGDNSLDNLCISSHHMNTAKGKMTDEEFRALLVLVRSWEDEGKSILTRLKQGLWG